MKMKCPYCQAETELPEFPVSRHLIPCPVCRKKFFTVGELTFRYGIRLPKNSPGGPDRVECPYCGQHYNINFKPLNGMLGCVKCLKVFSIPPESSSQTVDLSPSDMVSDGRLAPDCRDTASVLPYPPPASSLRPISKPEPVHPAAAPAAGIAREPVQKTDLARPDAVTVADVMISRPSPPSQSISPHRIRVLAPESLGTVHVVPSPGAPDSDTGEKPVPLQTPTGSFRLVRPDNPQEN